MAAAVAALPLSACTHIESANTDVRPIVMVHGKGDTVALWFTTLWRFESNRWLLQVPSKLYEWSIQVVIMRRAITFKTVKCG